MRMPSTPSPWLALLASFALHALIVLAGWYFFASATRAPVAFGTCVERTADHLSLSIIFDSLPKSREPSKPLDTRVNDSPSVDASVELDASRGFNPISIPPVSLQPVVAQSPAPSGRGSGTTPNTSSSQPGHGPSGSGEGTFFPTVSQAHSIVYVIDRSASMGRNDGAFNRACAEVVTSLRQLPPDVRFQVIVYNDWRPHCLLDPEQLCPAQPETVALFVRAINNPGLLPEGNTNHVAALRCALVLNPDAIFWVTDGDDFSPRDLNEVMKWKRGRTAIHLIELGSDSNRDANRPIVQLTKLTDGTYRAIRTEPHVTTIPGLVPQ